MIAPAKRQMLDEMNPPLHPILLFGFCSCECCESTLVNRLVEYPYVQVKFACRYCPRAGIYRLARRETRRGHWSGQAAGAALRIPICRSARGSGADRCSNRLITLHFEGARHGAGSQANTLTAFRGAGVRRHS